MTARRRVPEIDSEFNTYMINTTAHLQLMRGGTLIYTLLGLSAGEMTAWINFLTTWATQYGLSQNPTTKTKTVNANKDAIHAAFFVFSEPLLTRMEGSDNLIQADRDVLNIAVPDRTPTARAVIDTAPNVDLTPLEGAQIDIELRRNEDADRPSIHPLADGWTMVYLIGTTPPANPAACPKTLTGSKAHSTFDATMENDGKKLYCFFRWINITDPNKNGPWSAMKLVTISGGTV